MARHQSVKSPAVRHLRVFARPDNFVRDVGVAGSNPVTPTIDFHSFFVSSYAVGSTLGQRLGSKWGPVLSTEIARSAAAKSDDKLETIDPHSRRIEFELPNCGSETGFA
jgi:hypothetical protein